MGLFTPGQAIWIFDQRKHPLTYSTLDPAVRSSVVLFARVSEPTHNSSNPNDGSLHQPFLLTVSTRMGDFTTLSAADQTLLDTNNNGVLDAGDDAFSPYYPGDDVVDWIGLSICASDSPLSLTFV